MTARHDHDSTARTKAQAQAQARARVAEITTLFARIRALLDHSLRITDDLTEYTPPHNYHPYGSTDRGASQGADRRGGFQCCPNRKPR